MNSLCTLLLIFWDDLKAKKSFLTSLCASAPLRETFSKRVNMKKKEAIVVITASFQVILIEKGSQNSSPLSNAPGGAAYLALPAPVPP